METVKLLYNLYIQTNVYVYNKRIHAKLINSANQEICKFEFLKYLLNPYNNAC